MPFKEGNQLATKNKGKSKTSHVQEYLAYLGSGAARHYYEKLEEQANGKELTEPEREFMNRFERNTEFITPKLARTEVKEEIDQNITVKWES